MKDAPHPTPFLGTNDHALGARITVDPYDPAAKPTDHRIYKRQ